MHFQELANKVGISAAVEIRIIQNNVNDIELPFEAMCTVFDKLQGSRFEKAMPLLECLKRLACTFLQWRMVLEREPTPSGRIFALERLVEYAATYEDWCSVYHFAQVEEREDILSKIPSGLFTLEVGTRAEVEDCIALQTWIVLYEQLLEGTEGKNQAYTHLSNYMNSYDRGVEILARSQPNSLSYQLAIGYLARYEPEETASSRIQKTG
jgi:hypothetical protein